MKIKAGSKIFIIYFIYILFIWGTELADFLCFEMNLPQTTVISRALVFITGVIFLWKLYKHIEITKTRFHLDFLVGIFAIIMICLLKSVYPDMAFDTFNYHLILQRPGFTDYFTEHFAKGNFQIWGFRLGDRLFWLFREFLGYRYGTLLVMLVLILVYLQIYELLRYIVEGGTKNRSIAERIFGNLALWALLIILIQDCIYNVGLYYVDVLSLPIGFEVLRKLLESIEKKQCMGDILYMALLNGVWFTFKLTNIVFIIPSVLLYIYIIRRQMTLKTFMLSALFAGVPCSIYLILNYDLTGNPVFPYYNGLFQSIYFPSINWADRRWGGQNLFEKIFWLVYMILRPEYRQKEIPDYNTMIYLTGFCSACSLLVYCVIKLLKKESYPKKSGILAILMFGSALLWGITSGYPRYYLFGNMLLGIFAYCLLKSLYSMRIIKGAACLLTVVISMQSLSNLENFFKGIELSWRPWTYETFVKQSSRVFKDYEVVANSETNIDMFYLMNQYSGIADMYDPTIYVYNSNYEDLDEKMLGKKALEQLTYKNIYDIYLTEDYSLKMKEYVETANRNNKNIISFLDVESLALDFKLVRLDSLDNGLVNTIYFSNEDIVLECPMGRSVELDFICGKCSNRNQENMGQIIVYKEESGKYREVFSGSVDYEAINNYRIKIGDLDEDCQIKICIDTVEGEEEDFFIINPMISRNDM